MSQGEFLAGILNGNLEFLKNTLGDFSDADMLVRPVPGANHAAWQVGHLVVAENGMVNSCAPGAGGELPAGFAAKFSKETVSIDDPKFFPTKAELIAAFSKTRAATIAWVKSLTPADMEKPSGERIKRFAPTWGHLATTIPTHVAMHVGQFQVIRRKLGKPILF